MSGYSHGKRRATVESCARLDAGMLRRAGLLLAEGGRVWTYSSSGRDSFSVIVLSKPAVPSVELTILRQGEREPSSKQTVRVSWQSCNFGGARAWLHCPICKRRSFRLYFYPHTFAVGRRYDFFGCRRCAGDGLSYELRNARGADLWRLRQQKIVRKLGGEGDGLPAKPRLMRWKTYSPLALRWVEATREWDAAFMGRFGRLLLK